MSDARSALRPFAHRWTTLLITYRRSGEGVPTPVNMVVDGDRAVFRTWDTAGKVKRLRHNPEVTIAPATPRGKPPGPAIPARVRELSGAEAGRAARLLAGRHRIVQRFLVPLTHRLMRVHTVHYELRPTVDQPESSTS